MELKIRISLHTDEFHLKPIIEIECHYNIEGSQSVQRIEDVVRFIVSRKLREVGAKDGGK